jgi:hypothetical protein
MRPSSNVISFRAPDTLIDAIDLAREPSKQSRGDWIRTLVEAQLFLTDQSDQQAVLTQLELARRAVEDLQQSVKNLKAELKSVRGDLARSTALVLSQTMTTDAAVQLVRQNLNAEGRT